MLVAAILVIVHGRAPQLAQTAMQMARAKLNGRSLLVEETKTSRQQTSKTSIDVGLDAVPLRKSASTLISRRR